jgi:hypothetical protein
MLIKGESGYIIYMVTSNKIDKAQAENMVVSLNLCLTSGKDTLFDKTYILQNRTTVKKYERIQ